MEVERYMYCVHTFIKYDDGYKVQMTSSNIKVSEWIERLE